MVHFIGAGPGAPDLITVRGQKLLGEADIIIYAGSLVNPALLDLKKEGCVVYNSATMTLEQVIDVMKEAESKGQTVARLHTGDPCLLLLHDGAGTSLDDGHGNDLAALIEQLSHTDFLADNAFNHFLFLL